MIKTLTNKFMIKKKINKENPLLKFNKYNFYSLLIVLFFIIITFEYYDNTAYCFVGPKNIFNFDRFKHAVFQNSDYINSNYLTPEIIDILKPSYLNNKRVFFDHLLTLDHIIELREIAPAKDVEWLSRKLRIFLDDELNHADPINREIIRSRHFTEEQCRIIVNEINNSFQRISIRK
jgi:hypothetical protein